MRANTNRFLRLSIVLLALNQWIFNGLCAPEPTTVKTPSEVNSFDRITTDSYSLHIAADRDSAVRLDQQKQRPVDLNSSGEQSNVRAEVNASRLDLKVALNEKLRTDRKDEPKGDLTDDSIDHHDEPENDEIEEIIGRGKNVSPPSHRSPLDFSSSESAANAPIILSKSSESVEDEHSEIDSTTISPLFDSLNVTLPPLSRMIDLAEQGELDILNKTLPRRILIDMDTNEEIIGPNDIDRLLIDNDLDNNDFIETDILSSPAEECGRNRFNNEIYLTERIIGGNSTMTGEVPWMVSIRLKHPHLGQVGHWCGGVLISLNYVATASHCILNPLFHLPEPMYWEVRLGKHNIRQKEPTERTHQVAKLFHIKNYRAYDNDLAILKLEEKIEPNEYIRPICLPSNEHLDFSNSECYVFGWGRNDYNKKGTDLLQKVKATVYDNLDCHRVYYPKFRIAIKNWHLCAGNKFGGRGTCHADSGGPLQCRIRNRWYLAGITSFGSNCAKYGFPDVYTKITYFLNWIKEKMKNE